MVNGTILATGFVSGANMLYNKRHEVDALNVFPVPDGDTGTNMSMTSTALAKALSELQSDSVTKICDTMSYATLRGARGNSGVILSQYFRGLAKYMKGKETCTELEFAEGLKSGSDAAYAAVMNPTEGTILTVGRMAADAAVEAAQNGAELKEVVEAALNGGRETLAKTPEMLPALKNAGVVDAGGQGWVFILQGLYDALCQNPVEREDDLANDKTATQSAQASVDTDNIKFSYCTEFIVEKKNPDVDVVAFKKSIEDKGDCMLVIDDDEIVKVHIHTNHPGFVLENAVKMGSMINIKIDNMKYQHKSIIDEAKDVSEPAKEVAVEAPAEKKDNGFVAVCAGDGLADVLKDLGVDEIILGGQTMNPSTDDILQAVNKVNSDTVFVFPNNKNIIMAATQAAEISDKNVVVLPSKSVPASIAAMMQFDSSKTCEGNADAMQKAINSIKTAQITFAVRDTIADGKEIHKDDIIGIGKSGIEIVGKTPDEVLYELTKATYDDDNDEFITIYYGEGVTEEEAQSAGDRIETEYPDAEVSVVYGGQPLYYYIISVE